jgi:hypothetical protein
VLLLPGRRQADAARAEDACRLRGGVEDRRTGWFCFFYAITFGGFVGLVSFLGIFFHDQYALTKVQAGAFATLCAFTGSMIRPLGGYLSDRFGGIRLLRTRRHGRGPVKSDPIFLDISPASGGMNPNQGGRDESKAPKGFVWEQ